MRGIPLPLLRSGLAPPPRGGGDPVYWDPDVVARQATTLSGSAVHALRRKGQWIHGAKDDPKVVVGTVGSIRVEREAGAVTLWGRFHPSPAAPRGVVRALREGRAGISLETDVTTLPGRKDGAALLVACDILPGPPSGHFAVVSRPWVGAR